MNYELRYFEKTVKGQPVIRCEAWDHSRFIFGASAITENEAKAAVMEYLRNDVLP